MTDHDFIVVGAGSAGCVLAARLSEDPAARVLLLEAGGRDSNPWIHIPVGYFKTMHNPATDWRYRTEPEPSLNGRSLDWPRGKVLGGSSSINGLLYVRGQAQDFDHWRQLGNAGWAFDDVLPYFIKAEDQERGASEWHGTGGPQAVSDMRVRRDVCDAFIAGAEEIGIPRNDDINGARQEGAGYFQLHRAQRAPVEHRGGVPACRPPPVQPAHGDRSARASPVLRRPARGRCALRGRRRRARGPGARRGAAVRRRHRLAPDPSALRRRAGGDAEGARNRAGARPPRRR